MGAVKMPADVVRALQEACAEYPKKWGQFIFDEMDVPVLYVNSHTCGHFNADMGICKMKCKCKSGTKELTLLTRYFVKDNPWWESRAEDEQILVDSVYVAVEEQETINNKIALFLGSKGKGSNSNGGAGSAWSYIQSMMNDKSCTYVIKWPRRKEKNGPVVGYKRKYFSCPFHTGYEDVQSRIDMGGDAKEIAEDIIVYFLRPDYRLKEPWDDTFSWDEYKRVGGYIHQDMLNLIRENNQLSTDKATGIAWAKFHDRHPNYSGIKSNIEGVKLDDESIAKTRREVYLKLWRDGVDTTEKEALSVYAHIANGSECPITTCVPDGKYAAKIIRHTAVTQRFKEIWADDAEKHNAVVQLADGSYMSASAFNWLSLTERKRLLGCVCEHCVQEDVWFRKIDSEGLAFFTFKVENIYHMNEEMACYLSRLQELDKDHCPISSLEESDYDNGRRSLAYDIREQPSWMDFKAALDKELPEDEENEPDDTVEDDNRYVLNMVETADNLDILFKGMAKSGPITRTFYTEEELKAQEEEYILSRVKGILDEGKRLQRVLRKREGKHLKIKVKIGEKPKLKSEKTRANARIRLDKKLAEESAKIKEMMWERIPPIAPPRVVNTPNGPIVKRTAPTNGQIKKYCPDHQYEERHTERRIPGVERVLYVSYLRELDSQDGKNRVHIYTEGRKILYRQMERRPRNGRWLTVAEFVEATS